MRGTALPKGTILDKLKPLAVDQLAHLCDGSTLGFADTSEVELLDDPIGQERALEAIEFGTSVEHHGYNLYLAGSTGLGKHWILGHRLEARASDEPAPTDWCYVADFDTPDRPNALELPAGRGSALRGDMQQLVEDLLSAIPAAFQSDEYRRRAQEIQDDFKAREEAAAEAMSKKAAERDIALLNTPTGYTLAPLKDGKMLGPQEFRKLPEEERKAFEAGMEALKEDLREMLGKVPLWQRELRQRFQALDREVTRLTVDQLIAGLTGRYADLPEVVAYLESVRDDVVANGPAFRPQNDGETLSADDPRFTRYRVNLLVNNADCNGAPVETEHNPTYQNLVGRIEHVARMGTLMTDFTLIKPGALHRANGGYLVLDVLKLLAHPFSWDALKRCLNSNEIRIEPLERMLGFAGTVSLEPEPIPLQVKIALVGDRMIYYLLRAYDPEFGLLFKVLADFNEDMSRSQERDLLYARLVATLQRQQELRPLERDAVCRVVNWAARRVGDGEKLTLHIGSVLDLLQEADHFAGKEARAVAAEHVQAALDAKRRRADQLHLRLHEAIERGTVLIDTDGRQLAQVNGLAVLQVGDYAFGSPVRISATARLGSGDVVDIEREVNLGGDIHAKGVMILANYLASRYARYQPLSLTASLTFEQSYGEVEGDSASVAELCALLSAIGDLSLDQGIAVTGSVNQHGQIQAVGGVNEKIEGFFEVCDRRGLTGAQGVIIPAANVKDLMLRREVREAAAAGRFFVAAAEHVDQVMAALTGMPSGHPDAKGLYPDGTVNGAVQTRLLQWTTLRQELAGVGQSNVPG
jgi:lon-related putative ATP-dependent protease